MDYALFNKPLVIEPVYPHTHTIIFLHGLSSSAQDISEDLFEERSSEQKSLRKMLPTWKWVFPDSLSSYNQTFKEELKQWFHITSLTNPDREWELQQTGLENSVRYIHTIIDKEIKLVGTRKLVLGGASIGCATAVIALLTYPRLYNLAGFVGLFGWIPKSQESLMVMSSDKYAKEKVELWHLSETDKLSFCQEVETRQKNETSLPVFIGHSEDDPTVSIDLGRSMCSILTRLGFDIIFKTYSTGGHWIVEPEGVDDISKFLKDLENQTPQEGG
jgi:lysophospholipase-2